MASGQRPVHMTDAENVQPFWAITKHRHITEISSQPDVFSSAAGNIILFRKDQMDVIADESNPFNQMRVIISMDPPDHRTFRKVASGFSRRGSPASTRSSPIPPP